MHRIILSLISLGLLMSCGGDDDSSTQSQSPRFLYLSTNSPSGNEVVAFSLDEGGVPTQNGVYPTGGVGDADDSNFDAQGALRVIDDYLMVVNAGDHESESGIPDGEGSVSVFTIDAETGALMQIDQLPGDPDQMNIRSRGIRPVSLSYAVIDGRAWVAVSNQQDNPACFDTSEATTVDECLNRDDRPLSVVLADTDNTNRNVQLYRFDNGRLTWEKLIATYPSVEGGPAQASFSPDGEKFVVVTWGVGHIRFPAEEQFQYPSRVYLYDVVPSGDTLNFENARYFENPGISGSVGFSWSPDSRYVYASNFALTTAALDYSFMVLDTLDTANVFSSNGQSMPTGGGYIQSPDRPDVCWTWLNRDGSMLYGAPFAEHSIGAFEVEGAELIARQNVSRRGVDQSDTKDILISEDGKTAYALGGIRTHTISVFDVVEGGFLIEKPNSPYAVPASRVNGENVSSREQIYLGIGYYPNTYTGF